MDKLNKVMASWNAQDLETCIRPYISLEDGTSCPLNPLIQNQWAGPHRSVP